MNRVNGGKQTKTGSCPNKDMGVTPGPRPTCGYKRKQSVIPLQQVGGDKNNSPYEDPDNDRVQPVH